MGNQNMPDPTVTLTNRRNVLDDGEPLRESIVTNINDEIVLEIDSETLIGRTDAERGLAQAVTVRKPLELTEQVLGVTSEFQDTLTERFSALQELVNTLKEDITTRIATLQELLEEQINTLVQGLQQQLTDGLQGQTDALANFRATFESGANYLKLPGGLLQWGQGAAAQSFGVYPPVRVNFTRPFTAVPQVITNTDRFELAAVVGSTRDLNGFTFGIQGSDPTTCNYYWFAIGQG
jgi:hypothetical protein